MRREDEPQNTRPFQSIVEKGTERLPSKLPPDLQVKCMCGVMMDEAVRIGRILIFTHLKGCEVVAQHLAEKDAARTKAGIAALRRRAAGIPSDDLVFNGDLAEYGQKFRATQHTREGVALCRSFLQKTKAEGLRKGGLILKGPAGSGKTAIVRALGRSLFKMGIDVRYEECVNLYRTAWNAAGKGELETLIEALMRPQVLILDDLGRERVGGTFWVDEVMHTLFSQRMDRPILITTNRDYADLAEHWGSSKGKDGKEPENVPYILERMLQRCGEMVQFGKPDGDSHRAPFRDF